VAALLTWTTFDEVTARQSLADGLLNSRGHGTERIRRSLRVVACFGVAISDDGITWKVVAEWHDPDLS
jgi:hypothetical protein